MEDASIFIAELLQGACSLRSLRFIRSQDSIANGTLVIARLQLATGIRPVGRKAHWHNGCPASNLKGNLKPD
jgi:hypothetical protein